MQHSIRWRLAILVPILLLLAWIAPSTRADQLTNARSQLAQSAERRAQALQQLARARDAVAALRLQVQTNSADLAILQQRTNNLEAAAGVQESALTTNLNDLLQQLQAAKSDLAQQQQRFSAQKAQAEQQRNDAIVALRSNATQIRALDTQIASTQRDASALKDQVHQLDQEVETRSQAIDTTLVQMYKLSQVSALDLILSAKSLSDGLSSLTMLGTLTQHDQIALQNLGNARSLASHQHQLLSEQEASLQNFQDTLQADRQASEIEASDQQQLIQQLEQQLTAAQQTFSQQQKTLQGSIDATQQRIAATRTQLSAAMAPIVGQQDTVLQIRQAIQQKLNQAQSQEAHAQREAQQAAADEAAAQSLIQRLQADASARLAQSSQVHSYQASGAPHFIWPVQGFVITQRFGPTSNWFEPPGFGYRHFHYGIDLAVPYGTPIHAAATGVVLHAGWLYGGYGICVIIAHNGTYSTLYAHMSSVNVRPNQIIQQGQTIGWVGMTGNTTGPHVHFEIRVNGTVVNPLDYV
ncbi:MAG: peptidoglycan DD-metalloendopeptidase family protein [Chloroflexi bacterium]|nr:peptidoglycan DD-metalloendopeptidase family protein [Chloroflexota bacterium]